MMSSSETVPYCLNHESLENAVLRLRKALSELREANFLCDVVLETDDGGNFAAHRSVMAICSPYFKALFTANTGENYLKRKFCVPGITGPVLKEIVDYAYNGRVEIDENNAVDLLIAADQFNVLGLLKRCCSFLSQTMTCENCLGIRDLANNYFCLELEREAGRFINCHIVRVAEVSQEYLELPIEQVVILLSSDYINARKEEEVWEAGLRWINHRPEDRSRFTPAIMRCVRLGLLDSQYFSQEVKKNPHVETNTVCKPIVIETLRFLCDLEMIEQMTEVMETPALATPRIPYSIIFCIGGWSPDAATNVIETYDCRADRWIEVAERDPVGGRAYHKLAVLGTDIYVIGGFSEAECTNGCRCFNSVTKQWKDVAPMNSNRCYVSVATLNNLIYAIGGYNGRSRINSVERYDAQTNQWTFVAPMSTLRSDASATTFNGVIYVVGGFNGDECLETCEFYNPDIDFWTSVHALNNCRSGLSIITYHGSIYALGGFNGISRMSSGERYDPLNDRWSEEVPNMFCARSNFAVEVMDDMIFAIGGFNGTRTISHVECYDDSTNQWYQASDMNLVRSGMAACIISGLPNVLDYCHPNRQGLLEEKRLRLQQQAIDRDAPAHPENVIALPGLQRFLEDIEEEEL